MAKQLEKKRILIVEDEPSLSEAIKIILQSTKYAVTTVMNGERAIEYLKKNEADLVLLDLLLPRISGFDVLEYIRKFYKTPNVPVVIVTNYSDPSARERASELEATDFIVKTDIRIKDIGKLVDKYLGER